MAYFRKRGDKWSFTVDIGVDQDGKRRQKTVSGFDSKKDAEIACAELITNIERGEWSDNKDTVEGFMKDFMESHVKMTVAPATYENQLQIAKNHIYPILGKKQLVKLTPMDIQKLYSKKMSEGLSAGTVMNIGIILGKALRAAHQWGLITKNVASSVQKPSYRTKQMNVWTQEEVNHFLRSTTESRFHVVYLLALTTGMRIGEILALKWSAIDFKAGSLSVQLTTSYAGKKSFLKEPKTAHSRRLITLPTFVVSYLKQYRLRVPTNELDLVVPGYKKPIVHSFIVAERFMHDTETLGMKKIRFHDLRHTHATLLLQMGENPKVVQERLGHSNISTTLNTYSHVTPTMQQKVADKINDAFNL